MRYTLKAIFDHRSDASVDVEDHENEPVYGSIGADTTGAATDGGKTTPVYPPGTEPGALQNQAHADSRYFGTQSADSPPAGNTFEEAMGSGSQWGHLDDGRLQVPTLASWVNSGGVSHDADSTSYQYGTEMRSSDKYRNRSWDEAEPSLKIGWETRASDTTAWDASKHAIRRGWGEVTPEIDDDSYYRNHWTTRYSNSAGDGDYDHCEPPYIYASEARRSEKYRSRDWRDVESHLKTAREARHAGRLSSWENFKDAVKHGWPGISADGKVATHQSAALLSDRKEADEQLKEEIGKKTAP